MTTADLEVTTTRGSGATGVQAAPLAFASPAAAATFLRPDHDGLAELATRIVKELTEGDRDDVTAIIVELQARVLAHLDGEERDLLPDYAEHAPEDAKLIIREHAAIRTALAEMEVGTDLHLVRAAAVGAFLDLLRAHAERENRSLYRWAASRSST